jgi:hypothetical protein
MSPITNGPMIVLHIVVAQKKFARRRRARSTERIGFNLVEELDAACCRHRAG